MPINKKAPVRKSNTRYSTKPKSRTGSSSLVKSTKSSIFTKRNGLIVAGLAAVAGLAFVALSFASGTPNYQYSLGEKCAKTPPVATDPAVGTNPTPTPATNSSQDCKNKSAEAMVYRLYKGMFGRTAPDSAGYQYWTQKLAGDREIFTTAIAQMGGAKLSSGTDEAFITALYQNMLGRTPDARGKTYWLNKLKGQKKWSRSRVVLHFATTSESIRKNEAAFNTFLATAPVVKVTQTAAAEQKKRYDAMVAYAKAQKVNADAAGKNALAAKNALNAAKSNAGGSPSRERLTAIATNQRAAESEYSKAAAKARATENTKKAAAKLRERAAALAKYAPDIKEAAIKIDGKSDYSLTKIDANYALIKAFDNNADKAAAEAKQRISDIAAQYKIAEGKYEAEQNKIAAEQAAANAGNSGGEDGTGGPTPAPGPDCPNGKNGDGTCRKGPDPVVCTANKLIKREVYKLKTITGNQVRSNTSTTYYVRETKQDGRKTSNGSGCETTGTFRSITQLQYAGYIALGATRLADRTDDRRSNSYDNYPQYTLCRGKQDFKYWDYDTFKSGSKYYARQREVTCRNGGEYAVGSWQNQYEIPKSEHTSSSNNPLLKGLHNPH